LPWLHNRFTSRFAEQINRLTAITTNSEAGWFFGLDDEVVYFLSYGIPGKMEGERYKKYAVLSAFAINGHEDGPDYKREIHYVVGNLFQWKICLFPCFSLVSSTILSQLHIDQESEGRLRNKRKKIFRP